MSTYFECKIPKKLQKSIKNYNDASEVYHAVRIIAMQQPDYFSHFGADFLIKLTLYILPSEVSKSKLIFSTLKPLDARA